MKDNELINNEKYHTCGRCKYDYTPDNEYPCKDCIHGTDFRKDLWECNEESEDCISRKAVIDTLDNHKYSKEFCEEHHIDWSINLSMARIAINDLPSVTSKEKTGWHIALGMCEDRFCCSCGFIKVMDSKMKEWKYCPVCGGAKMVEPQESEDK